MPFVTVRVALAKKQHLGLSLDEKSLTVLGFKRKSPCFGIIQIGDRFVKVNRVPVDDLKKLVTLVRRGRGATVEFVVERKESQPSQLESTISSICGDRTQRTQISQLIPVEAAPETVNVTLRLRNGDEKLGFTVTNKMTVKSVRKGSLTDGIVLPGDVITHFDGHEVKSTKDIARLWKAIEKEENRTLAIRILRQAAPEQFASTSSIAQSCKEQITKLDVVVTLNEDRSLGLHLKRDLYVKKVVAGSPADGIFKIDDRITHANGIRMEGVRDFSAYWSKNKGESLKHKFTLVRTVGGEAEPSTAVEKSLEDDGFASKTVTVTVKLKDDRKVGIRLSHKLQVERVEKNSCADGVIQVSDVVTHLNGLRIDSTKDFLSLWNDYTGQEPEFTIIRKEEVLMNRVTVEVQLKQGEKLGIVVDKALKIAKIRENSPAEGLLRVHDRITHVNEVKVETGERFHALLTKCDSGKVKISVLRIAEKEENP